VKAEDAVKTLELGSGSFLILTIEKSEDTPITVKLQDESNAAPIKSSLSDLRSKIDAALKKSSKPVIVLYAREEPAGTVKLILIRLGLPDDRGLRFQYAWDLLLSVEKTVLTKLKIQEGEKRRWELDNSEGLDEKITSLMEDDAKAQTQAQGAGGGAEGAGAQAEDKKAFSRPKPPARRK